MVETAEKLHREGKIETKKEESRPTSSYGGNNNSYYGNRNYYQQPRFNNPSAAANPQGAQPPANKRAENGAPICNYCNIAGHMYRYCRKRLGTYGPGNPPSSSQAPASGNSENASGNE